MPYLKLTSTTSQHELNLSAMKAMKRQYQYNCTYIISDNNGGGKSCELKRDWTGK